MEKRNIIVVNYYTWDATSKIVWIIEVIDKVTIRINIKLARDHLRTRTIFQDNLISHLIV